MPRVELPDGSHRDYQGPVTVADIAADIGAGLARAALAGRVNGRLVDTSHIVDDDSSVAIITDRDPEGLEIIRHSAAHLLAHAVKELYPEAQVTIGPVIEDGFYYDFSYPPGFSEEDLRRIEKRMEEIAARDLPVSRYTLPRDEAVKFFQEQGELYKAEIIAAIPESEEISLYRQDRFVDLCRGPHVPSTGRIRAFRLMKVAGAYWRGDSRNEMLQRVYGTAWPDRRQLQEYLHRLEEAEKRDHRRLGRQLDLFHFQDEAPGMVFWHQRGWRLFRAAEEYIRTLLGEYGYQEVSTPQVLDRSLWERSGHWEKFRDDMFTTHVENRDYCLKPMNCPAHIQVFNHGLRSYRDLPLRIAEFGVVHRNEPSGTLHGLLRARRFTQDDAHVFCTGEQIRAEVATLIEFTYRVYRDFGFSDVAVALSTRPDRRVGADALWDRAEAELDAAVREHGIDFRVKPGEGAFYGPKLEFVLRDSIGRSWQCGTIQLDFFMPGRLGAEYVGADSARHTPVMIHRAILGSIERFIGILIEHHEGRLPAWLAPVQAVLLTITEAQAGYAEQVRKVLIQQGFRVESDLRNEKIGLKIREHTLQRIPYLLVVGDREVQNATVAVRTRSGKDVGSLSPERFAALLADEVASHGIRVLED